MCKAAQIAQQKALWAILLLTLLIGFLMLFFINRFSNRLLTPLLQVKEHLKFLAQGKPVEDDIKYSGTNEIAEIVLYSQQLKNNINNTIKQANAIVAGDYTKKVQLVSNQDQLGQALSDMTKALRNISAENQKQNWLKTGQNQLSEKMRGDLDIVTLSKNIITFLTKYVAAQVGTLYSYDEKTEELKLKATYAFNKRKSLNNTFKLGEDVVGQAALEQEMISITELPADYMRIRSSTGEAIPRNLIAIPFLHDKKLKGVIELASFKEFSDMALEFITMVLENIAIAMNSAQSRTKMEMLLEKTQEQTEELASQQEELRISNDELETQTKELKTNEAKLLKQKEALQTTNVALENARREIEQKAVELEISSKYKSEFLANMSHELRTPLNSLLILSQELAKNETNNLTDSQVEYAQIVYKSGQDLLALINDVLDLSKIEAGKMSMRFQKLLLSDLAESLTSDFKQVVEKKGLTFKIDMDHTLPKTLQTDSQRLNQILKNLVSNAIKFTEKGSIAVNFHQPDPNTNLSRNGLAPQNVIAISVIDTGIGIPKEKQKIIFDAFQQVDGSLSRKYSGTGLGLSISRELATLLGGEIQLVSQQGEGSTFTVYLPKQLEMPEQTPTKQPQEPPQALSLHIEDIEEDDQTILLIEDEVNFATILSDLCQEKGFKCLHAGDGKTGLELAEKYLPNAIILDIKLPVIDGWHVLDHLKENFNTRHIPVYMMSVEEQSPEAKNKGIIGFLSKPASKSHLEEAFSQIERIIAKKIKDLLIVEDDINLQTTLKTLIENAEIKVTVIGTGQEALHLLNSKNYDCLILDLTLPDISGFEVLKELASIPPTIIYTGKELSREEHKELQKYASSIIFKGVKHSETRLLDAVTLFIHQVLENLPTQKKDMIYQWHETLFKDKKILLADDDMRNVFAISSLLRKRGMEIYKAANGQDALDILAKTPTIDLVIMDVMMPVMDGYQAMQAIRAQKRFKDLPIIALTAKAMKGDYQKSLAAGANDYLSKPVEIERLLSLMQVWLYGNR